MLSTHLSAILRESHRVVQDCIQAAVDQALEQHHQAVKVMRNSQLPFSSSLSEKVRVSGRQWLRSLPPLMHLSSSSLSSPGLIL